MVEPRDVGIRWTIGDVSDYGFEALRLSVWGAWKLFGPEAAYAVCVNSLTLEEAWRRVGMMPPGVLWYDAANAMPEFLSDYVDPGMAEGVAWKFAPVRFFPDRYELALDNDCIFWKLPTAIRLWLEEGNPERCVTAEDVLACHGKFAPLCGPKPRNAGIRGLPPAFDFEATLREILEEHPVLMTSELDEQGLQVAALARHSAPYVVTVDEVTICSPFPPHIPSLGECGAHFVGLNCKRLPWSLDGRPATEYVIEHWLRHRPALYEKVAPGGGGRYDVSPGWQTAEAWENPDGWGRADKRKRAAA